MKKRYKFLLGAAALIAAPIAINKWIEKTFSLKANEKQRELNFSHRFGNIKYVKLGHGKPLVLLHSASLGGSGHEWDECINTLSRSYTVYVPDLLGFGNSSKPEMSYSVYLYASLINDFIREVVGEPCFVAAAGKTANFAVQSVRFQPDNFLKLMLISPDGLKKQSKKCPSLGGFIETPVYGTLAYNIISSMPFLWYHLKKHVLGNACVLDFHTLKKYHISAHYGGAANKYILSAILRGELDWDVSFSIKDINKPICLIWGEQNLSNPPGVLFELRQRGVKFDFVLFETSAALPHMEDPIKFIKCALQFFTAT